MDELLSGLRAAAETTRVRILFILAHGEAHLLSGDAPAAA